jgi:UDP-N-acetylmuramoyl-tripeptide--D-alanyl-D-alanine ligase
LVISFVVCCYGGQGSKITLMKAYLRIFIRSILEFQLKRLIARKKLTLVTVLGSVGKTSTKYAIASVLQQKYRVQLQTGNYNDTASVPLAAFGLTAPGSIINPFAWVHRLIAMEYRLWRKFEYDVLLLELGTDKPGEIPHFASYLHPNIAVVTAITPEHMENFKHLDAVVKNSYSWSR